MTLRRVQTATFLLILCLLAACSSTRLTYNNIDRIIGWYLDDYLSLNSSQDDFFEQRLEALLEWHRRDQLPRYGVYLDRLQQDLRSGGLTAAVLQERYGSLNLFWKDIIKQAAPDCAELLLRLSGNQRQGLYTAMAKKQQKLEQRYLRQSAEERLRRKRRQAEKSLKRFTGPLTDPQKLALERWADSLTVLEPLWLESRSIWQRRLRDALEGTVPEPEKKIRIQRLLVEPEHLWSLAYRQGMRHNEAATLAMLAEMFGSLTAKQSRQMQKALSSLKKDFTALAKQ